VNKGQQGSTERVITRGKRAKLFELSEKPRHFLASRILLFIRNNFLGASRLAWDDRFDALLGKQLPAGIAVIALPRTAAARAGRAGKSCPTSAKPGASCRAPLVTSKQTPVLSFVQAAGRLVEQPPRERPRAWASGPPFFFEPPPRVDAPA
jgi:hypothetical protein